MAKKPLIMWCPAKARFVATSELEYHRVQYYEDGTRAQIDLLAINGSGLYVRDRTCYRPDGTRAHREQRNWLNEPTHRVYYRVDGSEWCRIAYYANGNPRPKEARYLRPDGKVERWVEYRPDGSVLAISYLNPDGTVALQRRPEPRLAHPIMPWAPSME